MTLSLSSLPFYAWKLTHGLVVDECNLLAKDLGDSPFLGLDSIDQDSLKDFIIQNASQFKNDLVLKWKSSKKEQWFSWRCHYEKKEIFLFASDVTTLKEEQLSYLQILNAIPDMVLVKGEGSKIHWANKAFSDYYGMNNEELQELIAAPFTSPDYTQQYTHDDLWVWKNKQRLFIECEPVTRFDGVDRKFQTIKMPILNSNNEICFTVGISRDITESIENKERAYASAKMASLGEMAGAIAHEINNPIAVILGKSRHLKKYIEANSTEKVISSVESIEVHSYRIAEIVQNLLVFCREDGSERFVVTPFINILNQALSFTRETMNHLHINLSLEVDETVEVECISIGISQIILNLINNAIDSVAESKKSWIKIQLKKTDKLEFRIHDSGPGVPDEIALKIMQPFFTTKPVGKGTGLGLSICHTIARKHDGNLVLDRSVSKSCFLLTLPLKQMEKI